MDNARVRAVRQHFGSGAYSVTEFCNAFGFSIQMFYKLMKKDEGPNVMKVGARTLISFAAADKWCHQREIGEISKAKKA